MLGTASTVGAAGVLSGCSWFGDDPPPRPPDPLEPLLAVTRTLAARYDAVVATHPGLAGRLRPLHEAHLAHETALVEMIGRPELATASPGSATWTPPLGEQDDAVAELRDAERDAEAETTEACLAAPPERAALLGSIAAALATHAEVL